MQADRDEGEIKSKQCLPPSSSVLVVIMGVAGAGKSTIGRMLSEVIDGEFLDADDFHPPSNKEKMHYGIPLTDGDRLPWLQSLRRALLERSTSGKSVILACSALKEQYREILRSADPNYQLGSFSCRVKFVLLDVSPDIAAARLSARAAQGNHFMSPLLLQSQLDLLRIRDTEGVFEVDAGLSPGAIVKEIEDWMGWSASHD